MITVSLPGQISTFYLLLIPLIVANDERVFDQGFGVGEGLAVGFGGGGGSILTLVQIKSHAPADLAISLSEPMIDKPTKRSKMIR